MDTITIHADHVTVHLHSADRPPVANLITAPVTVGVDVQAVTEAVQASRECTEANSPALRFAKVFADGSVGEDGDDRTDHVGVLDRNTGLMWSVESLGDPDDADDGITQEHCIERCRELRLLGFDNWRLPTRTELASLIDDTRHEPAIDTNFFPRVKSRWHWTSTPCAGSSASAWLVYFYYGYVYLNHRDSYGFALAVRRVGQ